VLPMDRRKIGIKRDQDLEIIPFNNVFNSRAMKQLLLEANAFGTLPRFPWIEEE